MRRIKKTEKNVETNERKNKNEKGRQNGIERTKRAEGNSEIKIFLVSSIFNKAGEIDRIEE